MRELGIEIWNRQPEMVYAEIGGRERQPQMRQPLAATVGGLSLLVALAMTLGHTFRSTMHPTKSQGNGFVSLAWKLQEATVPVCREWLRSTGCVKESYWYCNKDDGTPEYKCCCNPDLWSDTLDYDGNNAQGPASTSRIQVQNIGKDLCLSVREDSFRVEGCTAALHHTVFKLPPRGSGPIELTTQVGKCMEANMDKKVKVTDCMPGNSNQQFALTKGSHGMVQWSQGGNMCLDIEGGKAENGRQVVLVSCVYWPKRPSQQFQLVEPPKHAASDPESPTFFCTSIMLWWTYESDLLKAHLRHKVGIFACDMWAVYSNKNVSLSDEDERPVYLNAQLNLTKQAYSDVMNGSLKCEFGGKAHTALNTPIFRRFWERLLVDKRSWSNDWIIKVDPDAVFFPSRLKEMLRDRWKDTNGKPPYAIWLNNCYLGLHGPIEVFSKQALGVFKGKKDECADLAKKHPQEDAWLGACFEKIGVGRMDAFNLLLEWKWACNERPASRDGRPPCYDKQVSFHPFKSIDTWFKCYNTAKKGTWSKPFWAVSDKPSSQNHHNS